MSNESDYDGDCSQHDSELDMRPILSIAKNERTGLTGRKSVVMEGYMMKRSTWKQSWSKFFFVLQESGRLDFFQSEYDKSFPKRARGCLPICLDTEIAQTSSKDGMLCIKIKTNKSVRYPRTVKLSACSSEEHSLWMLGLEIVRNNVIYVSIHGR